MAQQLTGRPASPQQTPETRVRLATRADNMPGAKADTVRFVYFYRTSARWQIVELDGALEWVPSLIKVPMQPGVNGVKVVGKGKPGHPAVVDYLETAVRWLRGQEMIEVPAEWGPDGSYVREWETVDGMRYTDAWTSYRKSGGNWRPVVDEPGKYRWLRDLIAAGKLLPPEESAIETVLSEMERDLARAEQREDKRAIARLAPRVEFARKPYVLPTTEPARTAPARKGAA